MNGYGYRYDGRQWGRLCEDCRDKSPLYGTWGKNGKFSRRWCKICRVDHPDAVVRYLCEDCKKCSPGYHCPNSKRLRWCFACSKNHPESIRKENTKCEDCKLVRPSYSMSLNDLQRWCSNCAKNHPGSFPFREKCRDCRKHSPSYYSTDGLWCTTCVLHHPGAIAIGLCQFERGCQRRAQLGRLCYIHQPGYHKPRTGWSRDGSEFLQLLEACLGITLEYYRFDKETGKVVGSEHCPVPGRHFRNDGFVDKTEASKTVLYRKGYNLGFEYQGSHVHGHPSQWGDAERLTDEEAKDFPLYFAWLRDVERFKMCEKAGTKIYYVLDVDFKAWKRHKTTSIITILREAAEHFPFHPDTVTGDLRKDNNDERDIVESEDDTDLIDSESVSANVESRNLPIKSSTDDGISVPTSVSKKLGSKKRKTSPRVHQRNCGDDMHTSKNTDTITKSQDSKNNNFEDEHQFVTRKSDKVIMPLDSEDSDFEDTYQRPVSRKTQPEKKQRIVKSLNHEDSDFEDTCQRPVSKKTQPERKQRIVKSLNHEDSDFEDTYQRPVSRKTQPKKKQRIVTESRRQ